MVKKRKKTGGFEVSSTNTGLDETQTVNGVTYINYKQGTYGAYGVGAWGDWTNVSGYDNSNGCGATATAVLASGYGCQSTPDIMAKYIPYRDVEGIADALQAEAGITCSTAKAEQSTQFYIDTINKALSEGIPMIVCVTGSVDTRFTSGAHYIVILGQKEDGTLIISNPGNGANLNEEQYEGGVKSFVETYMVGSNYHGIVVPDTLPTGGVAPNQKKKHTTGFEAGLEVITPGEAEVVSIKENSITLKFIADNKVKNMTMKIEGFKVGVKNSEGEIIDVSEGDILEKEQVIGETTEEDIKLLMRDEKKAIINNIEDYMKLPEKKKTAMGSFAMFLYIVYEGGAVDNEGSGPETVGNQWDDGEYGVGISQWTVTPSGDYLTAKLEKLYNKDQSFCSELKGFIGLSLSEIISPRVHDELKEVFARMGKKDKDYLLSLEMEIDTEDFINTTNQYWPEHAWILERSEPVLGTWFSLLNYAPGRDWISKGGVNNGMSDEEIIKRLCAQGGIAPNSQVDSSVMMKRFESQAKLAIDMLNGKVDAEKWVREGKTAYPEYENGANSGFLNGYY